MYDIFIQYKHYVRIYHLIESIYYYYGFYYFTFAESNDVKLISANEKLTKNNHAGFSDEF